MAVEARAATLADVEWFEPRLRQADRDELTAASGPDIARTLRQAIQSSLGRAYVVEGAALFGFAPIGLLSGTAIPWMVGTPALNRMGRTLNRLGKAYCVETLRDFPLLVNYVDVRNEASVRWLKRLGFEFGEPQPFGVEQRPFMRFEMRQTLV